MKRQHQSSQKKFTFTSSRWIVSKLLTLVRPGINVGYKSPLRYHNGTWKIWTSRLYFGDLCAITFFLSTSIFISRRVSTGKVRIVLIGRSLTEGLGVCRKLPEYCYRVEQKNLGESLYQQRSQEKQALWRLSRVNMGKRFPIVI